jgi:hypothetical protein
VPLSKAVAMDILGGGASGDGHLEERGVLARIRLRRAVKCTREQGMASTGGRGSSTGCWHVGWPSKGGEWAWWKNEREWAQSNE